jgi:hypothetical protein
MKTFVTDLAAKSSPQGHLSAFKHWLFVRQEALRYALAPVAVAIAFLARLALTPILEDASPYLLFVPAVLVAAGLGGLGPGLLATGLSVAFGFFVITMSPTFAPWRARWRAMSACASSRCLPAAPSPPATGAPCRRFTRGTMCGFIEPDIRTTPHAICMS